ncbi:unnamed protein product [Arctogadus glacialis]
MTASCQTCKTLLLALLVVWGVASMVIIAVWASQPEATPPAPCDQRLQEVTEKLEGAKVVWGKNKVALEEMVEKLRVNQTRQQDRVRTLESGLALSGRSLEACRHGQALLHGNISSLQQQLEQQERLYTNLSARAHRQLATRLLPVLLRPSLLSTPLIYFFHHYELPAILQQIRIQSCCCRTSSGRGPTDRRGRTPQQQQHPARKREGPPHKTGRATPPPGGKPRPPGGCDFTLRQVGEVK